MEGKVSEELIILKGGRLVSLLLGVSNLKPEIELSVVEFRRGGGPQQDQTAGAEKEDHDDFGGTEQSQEDAGGQHQKETRFEDQLLLWWGTGERDYLEVAGRHSGTRAVGDLGPVELLRLVVATLEGAVIPVYRLNNEYED